MNLNKLPAAIRNLVKSNGLKIRKVTVFPHSNHVRPVSGESFVAAIDGSQSISANYESSGGFLCDAPVFLTKMYGSGYAIHIRTNDPALNIRNEAVAMDAALVAA